jgi:hypothetical protein
MDPAIIMENNGTKHSSLPWLSFIIQDEHIVLIAVFLDKYAADTLLVVLALLVHLIEVSLGAIDELRKSKHSDRRVR